MHVKSTTRLIWTFAAVILLLTLPASLGAQSAALRPNRPHDPNVSEPLTLVLRPGGFPVKVLKIPRGKYILNILNRTGKHDVPIELDRMPGASIEGPAAENTAAGVMNRGITHMHRFVELAPGTYRLRVPGNARWVCALEVN